MSKLSPLKDVIASEKPLLLDGAMGTELYNRGIFINRCFEDANLSSSDLVTQIHRDYLQAGADIISTNSFAANSFRLTGHNLQDQTRKINLKAANLATNASDGQAYVSGSVGPLGVRIEPWGPTSFDEARSAFREQIEGLIEGGVDLISLETFSDITELQQAYLAVKDVSSDLPIFAHMVINADGTSPIGTPIEWAMKTLDEWEVDVIGLNCSVGPASMMAAFHKIRAATKKPISFMPNAGLPKLVDGRHIYMSTPEYMAEFTKDFLQAGVKFVGGCCGTTPKHIKAMATSFRQNRSMESGQSGEMPHSATVHPSDVKVTTPDEKKVRVIPFAEKSRWSSKLAAGEPVTTVELMPPAGIHPEKIIERSLALKQAGIDGINIPDGPRASARMSAMLTAVMIEQRAGIESILHYTCRDRNLLGMQSDMLGLHAIGVRNMLLVTGDPPKLGNYPDATGVFDVDAIGLTNVVNRLNSGIDIGGRPIGEPTELSIGVGVNPVHRDFDYEMKRFKYKVEAGAEWAITQPVFDVQAMYKFIEYINKEKINIPIIAGIWPLLGYRNALFLHNEVPGVVIPEDIINKMSEIKDPEDAKKVGVEIAHDMVEELGDSVQGLQLSAPFGRIDLALAIIGK